MDTVGLFDIVLKTCMIDDKCNSILLCVEHRATIVKVLRPAFPLQKYNWNIKRGRGVGSSNVVLEITCKNLVDDYFALTLGEDLGGHELHVDRLRFHLCTEDIETLQKLANKTTGKSSLFKHFTILAKSLLAGAAGSGSATAGGDHSGTPSSESEETDELAAKGSQSAATGAPSVQQLVHPPVYSAARPAASAVVARPRAAAAYVERRQHTLIGQAVLGHHKSYDNTDFRYFLVNTTRDPKDAQHMTHALLTNIMDGTTAALLSAAHVLELEPPNFEDMDDYMHIGDEIIDSDVDSGDEE